MQVFWYQIDCPQNGFRMFFFDWVAAIWLSFRFIVCRLKMSTAEREETRSGEEGAKGERTDTFWQPDFVSIGQNRQHFFAKSFFQKHIYFPFCHDCPWCCRMFSPFCDLSSISHNWFPSPLFSLNRDYRVVDPFWPSELISMFDSFSWVNFFIVIFRPDYHSIFDLELVQIFALIMTTRTTSWQSSDDFATAHLISQVVWFEVNWNQIYWNVSSEFFFLILKFHEKIVWLVKQWQNPRSRLFCLIASCAFDIHMCVSV